MIVSKVDSPPNSFVEDLASFSLVLFVLKQRGVLLNEDLRQQANSIKEGNMVLKETNKHLQMARVEQAKVTSSGDDDKKVIVPEELKKFLDNAGIDYKKDSGGLKKDHWNALVENMQTHIDSHKSTSQTDVIDLQAIINFVNENTETLSNVENQFHKTKSAAISNL